GDRAEPRLHEASDVGDDSLFKCLIEIRGIAAIMANDDDRPVRPAILDAVEANQRTWARCHFRGPCVSVCRGVQRERRVERRTYDIADYSDCGYLPDLGGVTREVADELMRREEPAIAMKAASIRSFSNAIRRRLLCSGSVSFHGPGAWSTLRRPLRSMPMAQSSPEASVIKAYWQPGCTSCLRMKEFLTKHGVSFVSVNVLEDKDAFAELATLGIRSVPIVRRGKDWANGQVLREVAR